MSKQMTKKQEKAAKRALVALGTELENAGIEWMVLSLVTSRGGMFYCHGEMSGLNVLDILQNIESTADIGPMRLISDANGPKGKIQ